MTKAHTWLLGAFTLTLTGCAPSLDFEAFDSQVSAFLVANDLEGAGVVVLSAESGVVHRRDFGNAAPGRISLIASASKVMSAGVLVKLADDGLIDLDAPVSDVLGAWGSYKTDITPAQLLSNSSGMVGLSDDATYSPYVCQYLSTGDLSACAETIYTADDAEDRVPPDTAYRYGGGAWHLAGGVATVATGSDWNTLIQQTYGEPCGLENTGYRNHYTRAFLSGGVDDALRYPDFFDGDLADLDETDNPNIEGGAFTTVSDYAKILEIQLRGGRCGDVQVLDPTSVDRMQADHIGPTYGGVTSLDGYPGYGLGWFVSRDGQGVADPGAFGATPWVDRERGYAALIMVERSYTDGIALFGEVRPTLDDLFAER